MITHEIGEAAGAIWRTLDSQGELTLAKLKKEVKVKDPVFHWALGWLTREEKVEISQDKRTFRVRLK